MVVQRLGELWFRGWLVVVQRLSGWWFRGWLAGGSDGVQLPTSTTTLTGFGRSTPTSTCRPVVCWSKSTPVRFHSTRFQLKKFFLFPMISNLRSTIARSMMVKVK